MILLTLTSGVSYGTCSLCVGAAAGGLGHPQIHEYSAHRHQTRQHNVYLKDHPLRAKLIEFGLAIPAAELRISRLMSVQYVQIGAPLQNLTCLPRVSAATNKMEVHKPSGHQLIQGFSHWLPPLSKRKEQPKT